MRRAVRALVGFVFVVSAASAAVFAPPAAPPATAADGNTLRQFVADVPRCSVGTGIAFDGSRLLLSCWYDNKLHAVSPEDGRRIETITVVGPSGIGALSWDRTGNGVWLCDSFRQDVWFATINGTTATAKRMFHPSRGCVDGLAYDGTDNTLFTSGDVDSYVLHYRTDGTLIDSRYVGNSLGGCGNSGIAVGGDSLFLANNGCSQIYRVAKAQTSTPTLFARFPERIEDIECDDVTFRSAGKSVIWSKDAYDSILNAFESNVGDCGFGGLPPAPDGEKFVYVALGDSYQSGEGVGNSIRDTNEYLTKAYENGSNYPLQVGPQQDTYTDGVSSGANSCHRSLANYAKINRDRLQPNAEVVLVDMTCSGAMIEPGGKPPIVGTKGAATYSADSQIAQALSRLEAAGLSATDVDLVTVGMGGNDARFGDIVAGCVAPNLLRELLHAYPDSPPEAEWIADHASCALIDRHALKTDEAIAKLQAKEEWAADQLLTAFGAARILQLDYPDILPSPKESPGWCGGIRKEDISYAKGKVDKINDAIRGAVAGVAGTGRYELVDVERTFGGNALCPGEADQTLANGLSKSNFDKEVTRLLNLDGNGDAEARRLLDALVARYQEAKRCWIERINPFGGSCDTQTANQRVTDAAMDLVEHLETQRDLIFANIIAPPSPTAEPIAVRVDRSRGLFHPNANGFAAMACTVLATYEDRAGSDCLNATSPLSDTMNGNAFRNAPFPALAGDWVHLLLDGLGHNLPVHIVYYSTKQPIGTYVTDGEGRLDVNVQLPDVGAGVHTLEVHGETPDGIGVHKRVRFDHGGRPSGDGSYGMYLCCFAGDEPHELSVRWMGEEMFTAWPDEDGGLFVEVPLLDLWNGPATQTVTAVDLVTGERISTSFSPIPALAGIWANGATGPGVSISGAGASIQGRVHSDTDVAISGNDAALADGLEYARSVSVTGSSPSIASVTKVPAGGSPPAEVIADYRPGGRVATARAGEYHAIPATSCRKGVWEVTADRIPAGVVYVPCAVSVSGRDTVVGSLIAAEGAVTVGGVSLRIAPPRRSDPAVVSGAAGAGAVLVRGAGTSLGGGVRAAGDVVVDGLNARIRCGIIARAVAISGTGVTVTLDEACRRP